MVICTCMYVHTIHTAEQCLSSTITVNSLHMVLHISWIHTTMTVSAHTYMLVKINGHFPCFIHWNSTLPKCCLHLNKLSSKFSIHKIEITLALSGYFRTWELLFARKSPCAVVHLRTANISSSNKTPWFCIQKLLLTITSY